MDTYIERGYAEVLQDKEKLATRGLWYLHHHAVKNEKKSGKVSVVFDFAAKSCVQSLNDYLIIQLLRFFCGSTST